MRRIHPEWMHEGDRLSSMSFKVRDDEPSVALERVIDYHAVWKNYPEIAALARLNVGEIRSEKLGDVQHDPLPEDFSHSLIIRTSTTTLSKPTRAKRLANLAVKDLIFREENQ